MKILILGAGRVGTSVAEQLVDEHDDITVIDLDAQCLALLQERLDLRTITGDGTRVSVLEAAGAADADLLIACATRDDTNLVACKLAKLVFNVPRCIARVRSAEFLEHAELMTEEGFDVDHLISPEKTVTDALAQLIDFPEALQVVPFAGGKALAVAVRACAGAPLVGQPVRVLKKHLPQVDARVVSLYRGKRRLAVDGETEIAAGDEVLCLVDGRHVRALIREFRDFESPVKRLVIAGGGNIGLRVAQHLHRSRSVKVLETSRQRCLALAAALPSSVLVLHGDATDEDLLDEANVAEADLFIALTSDDEDNIMSSLLAKRMGARRVMALIGRKSYAELMEGQHIDLSISPAEATIGELLRYVRRGDVVSVHKLRHGLTEVIEGVVHGDARNSRVVGRRIEALELPQGAIVAALVREDELLIAHHDTVVEAGDHMIVFVASQRLIGPVEALFQVSATFLG